MCFNWCSGITRKDDVSGWANTTTNYLIFEMWLRLRVLPNHLLQINLILYMWKSALNKATLPKIMILSTKCMIPNTWYNSSFSPLTLKHCRTCRNWSCRTWPSSFGVVSEASCQWASIYEWMRSEGLALDSWWGHEKEIVGE